MIKKGFIAMGIVFGIIIAGSDGDYFPILNILGLILMGVSCVEASKMKKRR